LHRSLNQPQKYFKNTSNCQLSFSKVDRRICFQPVLFKLTVIMTTIFSTSNKKNNLVNYCCNYDQRSLEWL